MIVATSSTLIFPRIAFTRCVTTEPGDHYVANAAAKKARRVDPAHPSDCNHRLYRRDVFTGIRHHRRLRAIDSSDQVGDDREMLVSDLQESIFERCDRGQ
jgi:hypothetical protein